MKIIFISTVLKLLKRHVSYELTSLPNLRSNFFLSDEKLTCVSIFPDASLELLAGGDERGALSLWYRSGDEDEDMGRSCRFVPHSDEVTAVEFGRADR